jgi:rhodanese-related sulfurtransferase
MAMSPLRISPQELAQRHRSGQVTIVDVREPIEFVGGHIAGSRNIPLAQIGSASLADPTLNQAPLVLVCQSGARSLRCLESLRRSGYAPAVADLEGCINAWQAAELPLERRPGAPLPLMRQVQISAGALVLLGVVLSQTLAPGWIWLSGFVGVGLMLAGITGFCGMARLLARMPWNRAGLPQPTPPRAER